MKKHCGYTSGVPLPVERRPLLLKNEWSSFFFLVFHNWYSCYCYLQTSSTQLLETYDVRLHTYRTFNTAAQPVLNNIMAHAGSHQVPRARIGHTRENTHCANACAY